MGRNIGLDFGTSNSSVAVSDGRSVTLLPIDPQNITPEVVKTILYITRDDKFYIGQQAVETYYRHNVNRVRRFVKKRIGEVEYHGADLFYVTDVYGYVDELQPGRLLQFIKTALRTEGFTGAQVFERFYSTADIITLYLQEVKSRAEKLLGEEISGVTLGRPVHFSPKSDLDKKSEETLRLAAHAAGFAHAQFLLEPVAAALYYGMSLDRPENALIFDFGGGTLDITIMRLGDPKSRAVYANGGIDIAGSDFDRTIIRKRMLNHFGQGQVDHLHEISQLIHALPDWMALSEFSAPKIRVRLREAIQRGYAPVQLKALENLVFNELAFSFYNAVERAKINLSEHGAAAIHLVEKDLDVWELYSRFQFEKDIREFQDQIAQTISQTISDSGLETAQIDAVVKTGGSSRIPMFTQMLENMFGKEKVKSSDTFGSVAAGLGLHSAL